MASARAVAGWNSWSRHGVSVQTTRERRQISHWSVLVTNWIVLPRHTTSLTYSTVQPFLLSPAKLVDSFGDFSPAGTRLRSGLVQHRSGLGKGSRDRRSGPSLSLPL